jgi:hypothetical protein
MRHSKGERFGGGNMKLLKEFWDSNLYDRILDIAVPLVGTAIVGGFVVTVCFLLKLFLGLI